MHFYKLIITTDITCLVTIFLIDSMTNKIDAGMCKQVRSINIKSVCSSSYPTFLGTHRPFSFELYSIALASLSKELK